MDVDGKKILITGAASGFGFGLLSKLSKQNAVVIAVDKDPAALVALEEKISKKIYTIECDVSDSDQVKKTIQHAYENVGDLDVLVNNAGIMDSQPLVNLINREAPEHSLELWHRIIDVNLNGVFYFSRLVAAQMLRKRTKGVILNVSSVAAAGNAGQTAYSASKAAIEAMTQVWAKELGPMGIRCAGVAPGFADTTGASDAVEQTRLKQWVDQVPLKRLATVDEVVDTMSFVIENDFINGKIIEVDGGLTI